MWKSSGIHEQKVHLLTGKVCMHLFCRAYGSFTMETIVAIAFGRFVNLQKGEQTELTEAARNIFAGAREGQTSSLQTVEFVSCK